jgi:hypothetical protein
MLSRVTQVIGRRTMPAAIAVRAPRTMLPSMASVVGVRTLAVHVMKTDDELRSTIEKNSDKLVVVDWTGLSPRTTSHSSASLCSQCAVSLC